MKTTKTVLAIAAVLSLTCIASAGNAPWPVDGHSAHHEGRSKAVFAQQGALIYKMEVGHFGFGGTVVGVDNSGKDIVYGVSHDSEFGEAAWAAQEGEHLLWKTPVPGATGVDMTPYLDEATGMLYFGSQLGAFHGLNAADGTIKWSKQFSSLPGFFSSAPTPTPTAGLVLLSQDSWGHAGFWVSLAQKDGNLQWKKPLNSSQATGDIAVLNDGSLIVATGCATGGRLFKSDAQGTTMAWDYCGTSGTTFSGTPAVDTDGTIYVSGLSGDGMHAFGSDGKVKWTNDKVSAKASPAVGPTRVYVIDTSNNLVGLDKTTGQKLWSVDVGVGTDSNRAAPAVDACGNVAAASTAGNLVVVKPDGNLLWQVTFDGQALSGPSVGVDGDIYVRGYGLFAFGGDTPVTCTVPDAGVPDSGGSDSGQADSATPSDGGQGDSATQPDAAKQDAGDNAGGSTADSGAPGQQQDAGATKPDGGGTTFSPDASSDGGCGCRTTGRGEHSTGWWWIIAASVAVSFMRRKR